MSTSNDIIGRCRLPGDCVWPECTCPGVARATITPEGVLVTPKGMQRSPTGPLIKRRVRPRGWSPLSDWVIVRTKTGSENWARVNCEKQDMETWNPRCEIPGKGKLQPLFPGHLFVRPGDKFRALRNTYGVIDYIGVGEKPSYVPKEVMDTLRKRADGEGIVALPHQRKPKIGERVQIKVGAFQECYGLYDGLSPEGRLRVLTEFMSQTVTLEFKHQHHVEVVDV